MASMYDYLGGADSFNTDDFVNYAPNLAAEGSALAGLQNTVNDYYSDLYENAPNLAAEGSTFAGLQNTINDYFPDSGLTTGGGAGLNSSYLNNYVPSFNFTPTESYQSYAPSFDPIFTDIDPFAPGFGLPSPYTQPGSDFKFTPLTPPPSAPTGVINKTKGIDIDSDPSGFGAPSPGGVPYGGSSGGGGADFRGDEKSGRPSRGMLSGVVGAAQGAGLDPIKSGRAVIGGVGQLGPTLANLGGALGKQEAQGILSDMTDKADRTLGIPIPGTARGRDLLNTEDEITRLTEGIQTRSSTVAAAEQPERDRRALESLKRFGLDADSLAERGIEANYTPEEARTILESIQGGVGPEAYREFIRQRSGGSPTQPAIGVGSFDNVQPEFKLSQEDKTKVNSNLVFLRESGVTNEQFQGLVDQLRGQPISQRANILDQAAQSVRQNKDNASLIGTVPLTQTGLDEAPSTTLRQTAQTLLPQQTPESIIELRDTIGVLVNLGQYSTVTPRATGPMRSPGNRAPTEEDYIKANAIQDPGQRRRAITQLQLQDRGALFNADGSARPITQEQLNDPEFMSRNNMNLEATGRQRFIQENGRAPTPQEEGRIRLGGYLLNSEIGKQFTQQIANGFLSPESLGRMQNIFNNIGTNSDREYLQATQAISNIINEEFQVRRSSAAGMQILQAQEEYNRQLTQADQQAVIDRFNAGTPEPGDKTEMTNIIAARGAEQFLVDPVTQSLKVKQQLINVALQEIKIENPEAVRALTNAGVLNNGTLNTNMIAEYQRQASSEDTPQVQKLEARNVLTELQVYRDARSSVQDTIEKINSMTRSEMFEFHTTGNLDAIFENRQLNNQSSVTSTRLGSTTSETQTSELPTERGLGNETTVAQSPAEDSVESEPGLFSTIATGLGNLTNSRVERNKFNRQISKVVNEIAGGQMFGLLPEQTTLQDQARSAETPEELNAVIQEAIEAGYMERESLTQQGL